ncbi:MAG: hypothetical protein OEU26_06615 [Candidatus Tectomicrobia bacterium]|nr:hypothetical protein [Candidatus Tectomicrobia bacterium]
MTPAWTQRRAELLRDCIVSPNVVNPRGDRLGEFVVPYPHALETEVGQRNIAPLPPGTAVSLAR